MRMPSCQGQKDYISLAWFWSHRRPVRSVREWQRARAGSRWAPTAEGSTGRSEASKRVQKPWKRTSPAGLDRRARGRAHETAAHEAAAHEAAHEVAQMAFRVRKKGQETAGIR